MNEINIEYHQGNSGVLNTGPFHPSAQENNLVTKRSAHMMSSGNNVFGSRNKKDRFFCFYTEDTPYVLGAKLMAS